MKYVRRVFLLLVLSAFFTSAAVQRVSPPIMPDPAKTPGDVLEVTKADICVPGYSKKREFDVKVEAK